MVSKTSSKHIRYSVLITLIVAMSLNSIYAQADGTIDENRTFNVVVEEPAAGPDQPANNPGCTATPIAATWSPGNVTLKKRPDGGDWQAAASFVKTDTGMAEVLPDFSNGSDNCGNAVLPSGTVEGELSFDDFRLIPYQSSCGGAGSHHQDRPSPDPCVAANFGQNTVISAEFVFGFTIVDQTYPGNFRITWTP